MVADPTAEARTEAGLMGAVGDTRIRVVRAAAVAGRIAPAAGERTLVAGGLAVAEGTSARGGVVADLEEDGRRVRRRWRGRAAAVERLEAARMAAARMVAGLRVLRVGIRRARTVEEATGDWVTPLAATVVEVAAMAGRLTATAELAAVTRNRGTVGTAGVMVVRDLAGTAIRPGIRVTGAAVPERHLAAEILG